MAAFAIVKALLLVVLLRESRCYEFSGEGGTGDNVIEGDIVVSPNVIANVFGGGNAFEAQNNKDQLWPNADIYYEYAPGFKQSLLVKKVSQAINEYNQRTCIRWKEIKAGSPKPKNYVQFYNGGSKCQSFIGMQGGKQLLSIGYISKNQNCWSKGVIQHEMMHALGFYHEQSRRDRDNYVKVNLKNVKEGFEHNFEKHRVGAAENLGAPYDEGSLMHYGAYDFSIDDKNLKTIVSLRGRKIGQRDGLSDIDVQQLNKLYNCANLRKTTPPLIELECLDEGPLQDCRQTRACTYPKYEKYMREKCPKSCGFCGASKPKPKPSNKECKDTVNPCQCRTYMYNGWCRSKASMMKTKCAMTCGFCKSTGCSDKEYTCTCQEWQRGGWCRYSFYANKCQKTCGKC